MEENTTIYLNVRTNRYHTSKACAGSNVDDDLGIMSGEFMVLRHGAMACERCGANELRKEHNRGRL